MGLCAYSQKGSSTDNNDTGFITRVKSWGNIHSNYPSTDTTNMHYVPSVG